MLKYVFRKNEMKYIHIKKIKIIVNDEEKKKN